MKIILNSDSEELSSSVAQSKETFLLNTTNNLIKTTKIHENLTENSSANQTDAYYPLENITQSIVLNEEQKSTYTLTEMIKETQYLDQDLDNNKKVSSIDNNLVASTLSTVNNVTKEDENITISESFTFNEKYLLANDVNSSQYFENSTQIIATSTAISNNITHDTVNSDYTSLKIETFSSDTVTSPLETRSSTSIIDTHEEINTTTQKISNLNEFASEVVYPSDESSKTYNLVENSSVILTTLATEQTESINLLNDSKVINSTEHSFISEFPDEITPQIDLTTQAVSKMTSNQLDQQTEYNLVVEYNQMKSPSKI